MRLFRVNFLFYAGNENCFMQLLGSGKNERAKKLQRRGRSLQAVG